MSGKPHQGFDSEQNQILNRFSTIKIDSEPLTSNRFSTMNQGKIPMLEEQLKMISEWARRTIAMSLSLYDKNLSAGDIQIETQIKLKEILDSVVGNGKMEKEWTEIKLRDFYRRVFEAVVRWTQDRIFQDV